MNGSGTTTGTAKQHYQVGKPSDTPAINPQ